jgi:hypothetical protein
MESQMKYQKWLDSRANEINRFDIAFSKVHCVNINSISDNNQEVHGSQEAQKKIQELRERKKQILAKDRERVTDLLAKSKV